MSKDRIQLNLRLDGQQDLLDTARQCARQQGISLNAFVVNAIKTAVGMPLDTRLDNVADIDIDTLLDKVLDSDRLRELIDNKTAYLATALDHTRHEVEDRIKTLENKIEVFQVSTQSPTNCPHCGSINFIKHGKDKAGNARYRCKSCQKTFT